MQTQTLAAMAAALVLSIVSIPARADDMAQNLGPVGPYDPILTSVGNKRVIAFYEPKNGHCDFRAVVWSLADENADSVTRFQADLYPQQQVRIEATPDKSLSLQCGDNADQLSIVDTNRIIASSAARF
jgi:hypothetical protein